MPALDGLADAGDPGSGSLEPDVSLSACPRAGQRGAPCV
jgi:hypothetical protein